MIVQFEKNRLGVIINQKQAVNFAGLQVALRYNKHSLGSQCLFNIFFRIPETQVRIFRTSGAGCGFSYVLMRFLIDFLGGKVMKFRVNLV